MTQTCDIARRVTAANPIRESNTLDVSDAELEQALARILATARSDGTTSSGSSPRRILGFRPRIVIAAALVSAVAGGAAIASAVLKTEAQEERGILDGHLLFSDSKPTCEQRVPDFFRCTVEKPPTGMTFYDEIDGNLRPVYNKFLGVKVQTLDATKHIDGGCVSISADGSTWNCYLGQSAVDHGIISADLLGRYQPEPAAG